MNALQLCLRAEEIVESLSHDHRELFRSVPARLVVDERIPDERAWTWKHTFFDSSAVWKLACDDKPPTKLDIGASLRDLENLGLLWRGGISEAQPHGLPAPLSARRMGWGMMPLGLRVADLLERRA